MLGRASRTVAAATAALAALAGGAQAAHWPLFGGDAGRSGNQAVGGGEAPVRFLYSKTGPFDASVKTSVLTTSGDPAGQRIAYGTVRPQEAEGDGEASANGRVHLRVLETGAAVGPEQGVGIDDGAADADVLGGAAPSSVSFADSSTPAGLGQLFAVHNDDDQSPDGDIAIAQVDEATGALVRDVPIAGTDGFAVLSSPLLTPPNTDGDRLLLFVARSGDDDERIFRVPIANAGSTEAAIGAADSTADVDAVPHASPALVALRDAAGQPRLHVAVGTGGPDARVRTFAVADLAAGPASGDLGDAAHTPTVPVAPDGTPPSPAPAVHVAARVGDTTVVRTLVQNGNEQALATAASSPALAGTPAPALATSQQSPPASAATRGRVIVTTSVNLYALDTDGLALRGSLSDAPLEPGSTGFGRTTAAVAGPLAYVTDDRGAQRVVAVDDAAPVADDAFDDRGGAPPASAAAFGQPAVSRSFVQFAGPNGLYVYVNRCGNPIAGGDGDETIVGFRGGDTIRAGAGDDTARGQGGDDCVLGGAGDDALSGNDGDDRVSAGPGADSVFGRQGDDAVSGNADDDRVSAGPGDDVAYGRRGDDGVSGNAGDDVVRGGPGNDTVFGRGGDDKLSGNAGDDRVIGGAGADTMLGRRGGDRLAGGAGADVIRGHAGEDRLFGGAGDDGMSGNADDDQVRGGVGDDRIFGRGGDDGLSGNAGSDVLIGGAGSDRLYGRSGDDVIRARDGQRDLVHCGSGIDRAVVDSFDVVRACERVARR